MNGNAILFHKTCVHPRNTSYTQYIALLRLLECNVFGIGTGGVRMRSKITPPSAGPTSQWTSLVLYLILTINV
jgi:hypothetical protein